MKKLLALLCVIAVLAALCIPAMAAEDKVPVVASVPAEWTTPYLYCWNGNGEAAAWPGTPMQEVDGWWYAYMPNDMENIIINNGNGQPQTGDQKVDAGLPVCVQVKADMSCDVEYDLPVEVPEYSEVKIPTYVIRVGAPESWASAFVWAWDDNLTNAFSAWPGMELTMGADGFWYGEVNAQYKNVVIAEKDGGEQTADLVVTGDENWILFGEKNGEGKYDATISNTAPEGFEPPEGGSSTEQPTTPPADAGSVKVHAMVPADWTQVNAWAWKTGDNTNAFEAWPGNAMTKDGDWYVIEVPGWVDGFIVNNGSVQTGDLTIEAGKEVWLDATDVANVGIYYEEPDIEAPTLPPETTPPTTAEPTPSEPDASEPVTTEPAPAGNGGLIAGIVVAVVAVIAGGIAIFFILRKKPE